MAAKRAEVNLCVYLTGAASATLLILAAHPAALALPAEPRVQMELVDGGPADGEARLAGVAIRLDGDWKTYWRHPGDSGIPPDFDFSASSNIAEVQILWPAPAMFHDGFGWVIGYAEEVVFPLVVRPENPERPVELVLDLDYGVCAQICVPMSATDRLVLDGSKDGRAAIQRFVARVPDRVDGSDNGVVGLHAQTNEAGHPELELHVRFPDDAGETRLIVEPPENWRMPLPQLAGETDDGLSRFTVPLDGAPGDAALSGLRLRVTGLSPDFAFEQWVTLD